MKNMKKMIDMMKLMIIPTNHENAKNDANDEK